MENQVEKKVKDQEQETDFIDLEWQELILDAKRMGLTVNEKKDTHSFKQDEFFPTYSIWKTNPGKYIKADLQDNGVTYKYLVEYWKIIDPSQAILMMNKDNILLISAKHDQYVRIEDTSHLWGSWGRPRRYVYNCGHSGIVLNRKKIAQDAIDFIRTRIMG